MLDITKLQHRLTGASRVIWEDKTEGCYILNSNKEKFECAREMTDKKHNSNFKYNETFDENGFSTVEYTGEFDFYETFEMTKYDATDKITIVIDYYREPVK